MTAVNNESDDTIVSDISTNLRVELQEDIECLSSKTALIDRFKCNTEDPESFQRAKYILSLEANVLEELMVKIDILEHDLTYEDAIGKEVKSGMNTPIIMC